jgi:hypothetical protein
MTEAASFDELIEFLAVTIRDAAAQRGMLTEDQAKAAVWETVQTLPSDQMASLSRRLWIDAVEGFYKLYVKPVVEAERH